MLARLIVIWLLAGGGQWSSLLLPPWTRWPAWVISWTTAPSHPHEASRQGGTSWDRQEVHLLTLGSERPRTADGQPLMVSLPSPVRVYRASEPLGVVSAKLECPGGTGDSCSPKQ